MLSSEGRRLFQSANGTDDSVIDRKESGRGRQVHDEQNAWREAQERVSMASGYSVDAKAGEEEDENTRKASDPNYLSNELRAQATRERILGEARNGCNRVLGGAVEYYVTPPLNSYYRRLVHMLATEKRLTTESLDGVGYASIVNQRWPPPQCEDCFTSFCLMTAEARRAAKSVVVSRAGILTGPMREQARANARSKCQCIYNWHCCKCIYNWHQQRLLLINGKPKLAGKKKKKKKSFSERRKYQVTERRKLMKETQKENNW